MQNQQLRILLDTNVWLDRYVPHRPGADVANALLSRCVEDDVIALYPLRSIGDVFWQVTKNNELWVKESKGQISEAYAHAINAMAWDCVTNMQEIAMAVGAEYTDVWRATKYREIHSDFEDNMVLAAAERAKVDYLVTSDRQLIEKATVCALTPEDMLTVLRMRCE